LARKILLADDSVTAQNMGRKILADAGYEVITVNNGSAALKKIAEHKPDLIVLDVYMPGYSGLEVCQRLKEVPETSRIPVILTVGKLEPFKPEEAKRVRAEGFIVKPFEASELLSALSKLEDKIVPRSEPSKPGRFARAIASVEQSNRDKTVPLEEDSGWKNRISFPSKKKKKEEGENGDEPASYNAVNRDLRTVVPREQVQKEDASSRKEDAGKAAESTVDVAAVAPAELPKDSLPKDVTPEEIAAIAAAAAQVQGASAASKETSATLVETKSSAAEFASVEHKNEQVEAKSETEAAEVSPATFAEHKSEENLGPSDVIAAKDQDEKDKDEKDAPAISALESGKGNAWNTTGSGNGAGHSAVQSAELPVSMAAASTAVGSPTGPRWTAVAVSIDAAESAISLEQEMQKAQGTLVVDEPAHVAPVVAAAAVLESSDGFAVAATPVTEPVARAATHEETELAHALSAAANVAAEAVTAAVTELAAPHGESMPSVATTELASPVQAVEIPQAEALASGIAEEAHAHAKREPEKEEYPGSVEANTPSTPADEASSTSTYEPQSADPVAAVAEGPQQNESAAGGIREMAEKKDSELNASTAAAWASWRQIRSDEPRTPDSAKPRRQDDEDDEPAATPEPAAMAVAAGAEKSPEEGAPGPDPKAIASIVDSVLAELRPKIAEEISRKLGEKK